MKAESNYHDQELDIRGVGMSALHIAAQNNDLGSVQALLNSRCNLETKLSLAEVGSLSEQRGDGAQPNRAILKGPWAKHVLDESIWVI